MFIRPHLPFWRLLPIFALGFCALMPWGTASRAATGDPAPSTNAAPSATDASALSDPGETAILSDIHAVPPAPSGLATNAAPAGTTASSPAAAVPAADGTAQSISASANIPVPPSADLPGAAATDDVSASLPLPNPTSATASASPTQNVTINLINLMVKRGLITKDDAAGLIKQAEDEAAAAQEQAVAQAQAQAQAVAAAPPGIPAVPADGSAPPENEDDSVNVNYIPDSVRQEMKDEIKQDVLAQARRENWAAPQTFPNWASRFTFFGDTRFRFEDWTFPNGNDDLGAFFNFNSINTGAPLNNVPGTPTPFYNVDQDRDRLRLRARFGVDVTLDDGFTTGLRVATGSDDSPVTENQTFGGASNGQGGDFAKYAIWLDRAFLKYQYGPDIDHNFSATLGRFENPFLHTSMLFANDLGFDGVVLQGKYKVLDGVTPFGVAGAFPVYNTDLNFASTNPVKFSSEDKWLYAGQAGVDWKINKDFNLKSAVALYDYENVQGKLSSPFIPLTSSDQGNTDDTRPSFAQNGNTYFPIRNIDNSTVENDFGALDQFQYYGLATAFHELALTTQLDISHFDPFHIQLTGEFVKNLAFDYDAIDAVAINNLGPNGHFAGGDSGYLVHLVLGAPLLQKRWDWNVDMTYRYVESDATVDGFTDSDFGGPLAGTNLEGYTLGGGVALSSYVWLSLRWMSADSIAGPPFRNDLVQFDVNSHF